MHFEGEDVFFHFRSLSTPPHCKTLLLYRDTHIRTIYEFRNEFHYSTFIWSHLYLPIFINNYALGLEIRSIHRWARHGVLLSYLVSLYYKEPFLYRDIKSNTTHAFNIIFDSLYIYSITLIYSSLSIFVLQTWEYSHFYGEYNKKMIRLHVEYQCHNQLSLDRDIALNIVHTHNYTH